MNKWIIGLVVLWLVTPLLVYVIIPFMLYGNKSTRKRIVILVLGDLGRSPRMCYHALSFANTALYHDKVPVDVELCGYIENKLPQSIIEQGNINITNIPIIQNSKKYPFIIFAPYKIVAQVFIILHILWKFRGSEYILIQNPPSVPLLPVVVLYKIFFTFNKTKLIIDWHNFGYSILKMKFNDSNTHPFVRVHYILEYIFAKFADYNLTVTHSMKEFLNQTWGLRENKISVLHDRPGVQFKPITKKEDRDRLIKTSPFINKYLNSQTFNSANDKILVTSTSFTPDEDISILIDSLIAWNDRGQDFKLHCFITGKGPLKPHYVKMVDELKLSNLYIHFVWLTNEEYPLLLQLCDFGVSLHMSSSGLDLPMKILDMFGSGIPVIAYGYPTLKKELVFENENGYTFTDSESCLDCLKKICSLKKYTILKENVIKESKLKWQHNWESSIIKELKL